jgi:hypothetical protein
VQGEAFGRNGKDLVSKIAGNWQYKLTLATRIAWHFSASQDVDWGQVLDIFASSGQLEVAQGGTPE